LASDRSKAENIFFLNHDKKDKLEENGIPIRFDSLDLVRQIFSFVRIVNKNQCNVEALGMSVKSENLSFAIIFLPSILT
jgi:hypothetical protein